VLAVGCGFRSGELVGDDGGPIHTNSYGSVGHDDRFTWTEDAVIDRTLIWDRNARALDWEEAARFCEARGTRLPTREELMEISDVLGTDLFPTRDWSWSSSPGSRESTAWAVGSSGYANANDVRAKSLVRCVSSR